MTDEKSFGRALARARKNRELSQKELAALIKREDGGAISPQYLNDIEHDRRSPSSDHLVHRGVQKIHPIGARVWLEPRKHGLGRQGTDESFVCSYALVKQFAEVLGIDLDYLYYLADRLPEDIRRSGLSQEEVSKLMMAFRGRPAKRSDA